MMMFMKNTIESELAALESANLYHLIPTYLFDHFKLELNDQILKETIQELDHLLQTSDTNNSFRILSLNDSANNKRMNLALNDSNESVGSSLFFNKNSKSFILEIATRLVDIFQKYNRKLSGLFELIDREVEKLRGRQSSGGQPVAPFKLDFISWNQLINFQRSILVQKLNSKHYDLLNLLFRHAFDFYNANNKHPSDDDDEDGDDDGEGQLDEEVDEEEKADVDDEDREMSVISKMDDESTDLISKFHELNRILFNLELFDHLCGDIVVEVVQNKIRQHIENTSMDNYQKSFINSFEIWLEKIIIGWIKLVYSSSPNNYFSMYKSSADGGGTNEAFAKFDEYLNNYKKQLAHFMYTHYAHVRIKRLFDIVIDFPDSKCAINDLKICLEKTNLRSCVVKALKTSIEQRLLHPGVNTSDILTAYVAAIKALMCLDSSGVMMENICQPLKKYLRNREDTVKCIVSNLTDDGESSNEIMEEFCKDLYSYEGSNEIIDSNTAIPIQLQSDQQSFSRLKAWEQWVPDPIDAMSLQQNGADSSSGGGSSGLSGKSNIISMLVNIYGSKDMFVNEYKTLLADRLLSNYSYNMEKEIRNLELLKLKFGDSNLFACEAMLKDLSESKRINTNIIEQLKQKNVEQIESFKVDLSTLKCVILSEQFWPKLKEEKVEMPFEFKQIQEKYMSSYEAFKGNRTLTWKNNLGLVTIDIEINGKVLEFTVNPIQASVIMKFQEKETWSLLDLSQSLKMCSFALRKKLAYWKAQGLIKELDPSLNVSNEINTTTAATTSNNNNNPNSNSNNNDAQQQQQQQTTESAAASEIYTLVKDGSKLNKSRAYVDEEEDDNEKTAQSSEILREQDLNLFWNYTQSMLRGCGCLPLERIHAWLKLYANPDLTIEQVKFLLETKTKEQLLKYNAGLYRLNR